MSPRVKTRARGPAEHRGLRAGIPAHVEAALRPLVRAARTEASGFSARHARRKWNEGEPARAKRNEGRPLVCPTEAPRMRACPSEVERKRVTRLPDRIPAEAGNCISNRNIPPLEPRVTQCKQRAAMQSNRNKTRLCINRLSAVLPCARRTSVDACQHLSNRQKPRLFNGRFSGPGRRA